MARLGVEIDFYNVRFVRLVKAPRDDKFSTLSTEGDTRRLCTKSRRCTALCRGDSRSALNSSKRETPRDKPVASGDFGFDSVSSKHEIPRGKPVVSLTINGLDTNRANIQNERVWIGKHGFAFNDNPWVPQVVIE